MIKEFRKRYNMTQQRLSDLSGVSRSYIGELEKKTVFYNPNNPKVVQLYRFMSLYNSQNRCIENYRPKPIVGKVIDFFANLFGVRKC